MEGLSYWETRTAGVLVKGPNQWPEGEHVHEYLKYLMEQMRPRLLFDYGCGKGRMCDIVLPENYIGYDINEDMVIEAAKNYPEYHFTSDFPIIYPDCTLLYTVISMVSDEELPVMLEKLNSEHVVIGEILGRDWEVKKGWPHIYNRELDETVAVLAVFGYELVSDTPLTHAHYQSWARRDTRMHILVFKQAGDFYESIKGIIHPHSGERRYDP